MCNIIIYLHSLAMEKAKISGHDVTTCIVVRHLPRLYRSMNATNGTNGSSSDIIDLHSDVYFFLLINRNMIFLRKIKHGSCVLTGALDWRTRLLVARWNGWCRTILLSGLGICRRSIIHVIYKVSEFINKYSTCILIYYQLKTLWVPTQIDFNNNLT